MCQWNRLTSFLLLFITSFSTSIFATDDTITSNSAPNKSPNKEVAKMILDNTKTDFSALSLHEIVQTPEYGALLTQLRKVFKTELHAHLGGAVSMEFIRQHTTDQDYAEIEGFINQLKGGIDYSEGFKVFSLIGKVLTSNQRIEEAAFDFCRCQHGDHVIFSELRTGLKRLDGSFEDYLTAVLRGLKRGIQTYPIQVNLLLSVRRDTSCDDANETVDLSIKYKTQGITGIDVSGDSTKGDGSGIFAALKFAKSNGLPVTLHIGESKQEKAEQQMRELTEIQPERIGHGVHLSTEARRWIQEKRIPVEACIRSALSVGMIIQPNEHPAIELFNQGHPVVFCTDDSTLFGDLSEELALVACLCNLSIDQMIEQQQKSLGFRFK
jgi:adenosine deaminase